MRRPFKTSQTKPFNRFIDARQTPSSTPSVKSPAEHSNDSQVRHNALQVLKNSPSGFATGVRRAERENKLLSSLGLKTYRSNAFNTNPSLVNSGRAPKAPDLAQVLGLGPLTGFTNNLDR